MKFMFQTVTWPPICNCKFSMCTMCPMHKFHMALCPKMMLYLMSTLYGRSSVSTEYRLVASPVEYRVHLNSNDVCRREMVYRVYSLPMCGNVDFYRSPAAIM